MNRRLLFFIDIDDTFMWRGGIPSANINAILRAQEKGHKFFINTGRSYGFIPPEIKNDIPFDGYVSSIGAHIIVGGHELLAEHFEFEDFYRNIEPFARAGYPMHIESYESVYSLNLNPFPYETLLSSFDELKEHKNERFSKATVVCHATDSEKARFGAEYQLIQNPRFLEVSRAGYTKASGIFKVIEHLNVSIENTVAIGDARNDLPMLKAAGIAVTLENALPEVKAQCDLIVPSAENAGFARAVEILTEEKG